jgi:hypothetical protein
MLATSAHPPHRSRVGNMIRTPHRALFAASTVLLLVAALLRMLDTLPEGLRAIYFSDLNWGTPACERVDAVPSTRSLFGAWHGRPPATFSAAWSGSVIVLRDGPYTFAIDSDDGSWLDVDGHAVVDNGGHHAVRTVSGSIHLEPGVHAILIRYFQGGGPLELNVSWARGARRPTEIPSWALTTRRVGSMRFTVSVVLRRLLSAALWLWVAACAIFGGVEAWRRARRIAIGPEVALAAAGALVLVFVLPHDIEGDGRIRYLALAELIEWHDLSSMPYSMIGPLISSPLYLFGRTFDAAEWWCARFNVIVFVAGLYAMNELLRGQVQRDVRARFLLLLMAASMFPAHVEGYFAEVFTAVLVAAGLLAVGRGHWLAGWSAAVVGAANTPASVVGLGLASLMQTWNTRRLRHLLPIAAAAASIGAESWIRRGSPLVTGYEGNHGEVTMLTYSGRPGFSYPMFFGVLSVLFSFGKGIVFYAPGLLLPIRRAFAAYKLWLAFLVGLVLVYARWWAWWGGLFWGPRFFLFASIPASFAVAVWLARVSELTLARMWALLAVLTLSTWVAIDGVVFGFSALGTCRDSNLEWLCLYVPEFSALWRPFVVWTAPTFARTAVGLYFVVVFVYLARPVVAAIATRHASAASAFLHEQRSADRWRF